MFRHSTKLILAGLTTAAVMATAGCSHKPDAVSQGSAQVAVHALSLAGDVKAMDVAVSGTGIGTPIVMPLFLQADGTWKALVNHIPVGSHGFAAKAYDSVAKTHEIYSGSVAGVTINKNEIADVIIVMQEDHAPGGFGNHAPIVDSLSVSATSAIYGEKIAYTLAAHDPDPNETASLTFVMNPTCGTFGPITLDPTPNAQGQRVWSSLWTAPPSGASCQLNMVITDIHGAKAMAAVTISISAGVDVGGARVSTLVESYPVISGITTDPAIISGASGSITLTVLYSMSDNEPASFAWTHPDCDGSFSNANIANPVFTLNTVPTTSVPPICTFGVVVSGPSRTPTNGVAQQLSTSGSLTVNVGESTVPQNNGGGVAIDMTSQSLETVVDPTQPVVLYVKASEHTTGATLTSYVWSKLHGTFGTQIDAPDLGNSQIAWTPPSAMDPNENVNVLVTDSLGATASYTFIIGRGINPCIGSNTDNVACSDGNPCTLGDHCMNQVCVSGPQNPCTAIDQCHTVGQCDTTDGSCSKPLADNGKQCNDGHGCTTGDVCTAGVCAGIPKAPCQAQDACHSAGQCDDSSQNGDCSNPIANVNGPCTGSDPCMVNYTCQSDGSCAGTSYAAVNCTTPGTCHTATGATCTVVSNAPTCVYPIDNTATCSDGNACTTGDFCSGGTCQSGTGQLSCTADACHQNVSCVPPNGCSTGDVKPCQHGHCRLPDGNCATCPAPSTSKGYNVPSIVDIAVDGAGNQYMATTLYTTADFGQGNVSSTGSADILVVALDPNNALKSKWTKVMGGPNDQFGTGVAVGQSGFVGVLGHFSGNIAVKTGLTLSNSGSSPIDYVIGLNNNGTGAWGMTVDDRGALSSIAGNPNRDEFVLCGNTQPCSVDPNDPSTSACPGPMTDLGITGYQNPDNLQDIIIAKVNATTGAVIWSQQFGGAGTQLCTAVALADDGTVYATGKYNGTLDFHGNTAGPLTSVDSSALAVWVAKFDNAAVSGTTPKALIAQGFGTVGKQGPKAIALHTDSLGNTSVAVAGYVVNTLPFGTGSLSLTSNGKEDAFVAKFNSSLTPQWATSWGDLPYNQEAHGVAFNSLGDIVVVGLMTGTSNFGTSGTPPVAITLTSNGNLATDAYWAKFDGSDGTAICAAIYGDTANQSADAVAISSQATGTQKDLVNVVGFTTGTVDFGSGGSVSLITGSTSDGFFMQMNP
jgi:hypothetical protein